MITKGICHFSTYQCHEETAEMGYNRLHSEVGSLSTNTHIVHSGSIYHNGTHAVAKPYKNQSTENKWIGWSVVGNKEEIEHGEK